MLKTVLAAAAALSAAAAAAAGHEGAALSAGGAFGGRTAAEAAGPCDEHGARRVDRRDSGVRRTEEHFFIRHMPMVDATLDGVGAATPAAPRP